MAEEGWKEHRVKTKQTLYKHKHIVDTKSSKESARSQKSSTSLLTTQLFQKRCGVGVVWVWCELVWLKVVTCEPP